MGGMEDLEKNIGKVPLIFRELADMDPEMHDKILAIDNMIWGDGALTRQHKKIIAIAIAASLRDGDAVSAQMAGAKNLGIKKEEIEEGLKVAFLLSGMPAYVQGRAKLEKLYQ
ncbi:carboxymuconolactone decarboxylase family protein [Methanoplanus sp. FWC-SCC4]|uniref:Carboxymuconolactone decarboxylase family protein n=1 Tax=Methanochimaera problematica TaxID=2609417 RepID=A0AA97FAZ0_9EURY|nr:carboxymuconolactone decarboxylase family protein [Methanoplanus sp. FWC-SCC4]WOF15227.1 carboxymuconolactone decarboxylase family protein [Methanoplanus sp. FWC-SCC4]